MRSTRRTLRGPSVLPKAQPITLYVREIISKNKIFTGEAIICDWTLGLDAQVAHHLLLWFHLALTNN